MSDQDPFARAGQPGEPAPSAGPAPRDGSASAGVRYEPAQHDASRQEQPGYDAPPTPANPGRAPGAGEAPGGTATMPRTEQPTEQHGSPWATGPRAGGWGQPSSGPPSGPPPTAHWSTGGSGGGDGRRRRSPLVLVSAALAALLVAGGVGGVVGYEAASAGGSGGGSSVLAGTSGSSSSSGSAAPAGSVESVAQKVLPSVVQLRGASGEGSGIVISADGLILTNAHVLEAGQPQQQSSGGGVGGLGGLLGGGQQQQPQQQAPQLQAVFQNGQVAPVQVVGTDATADLAVVRAAGVSGLTPVTIGSSSQLQVGQGVVAVGSPLGLTGTVTSGIVSALQRPVVAGGQGSGQATVSDAIQTDAAINPGNSGGALVDMDGRVIGITSSIASLGSSSGGGQQQSGSIGLGFAIPIDQAKRIGDQLAQQGFANQAVLGVGVAQDQQGAASENGATIGTVTPGGPAANAGLKQGDVVTKIDDRLIDDGDSLVAAVRAENPGAQVTMTVQSPGGQPRQVPVTLGTERAPSS